MERREFLGVGSRCCAAAGMCVVSISALVESAVAAPEKKDDVPGHTPAEKVEFAEAWIVRFMNALDRETDEQTRTRIMETNGRACASASFASQKTEFKKRAWDDWLPKVKNAPDGSVIKEGNTIIYSYVTDSQGKIVPDGVCGCMLVESKPAGLSPTYCACSVGYMKEWWERMFDVPLKVELIESSLRGGKHCRYRIQKA